MMKACALFWRNDRRCLPESKSLFRVSSAEFRVETRNLKLELETTEIMPDKAEKIGVLGAGTMGAGIAQVAAQGGFATLVYDIKQEFIDTGLGRIRSFLQGSRQRGKISAEQEKQILDRLHSTTKLQDFQGSSLIIEAAPEKLELKRDIFKQLDGICSPETLLATNTSSFSVTAIAASTRHPERVLGLHFFNPPPLMALVEVIQGDRTSAAAIEKATAIMREMGKTPARAKDTPGFIVNRVARPFYNEALRIQGVGAAAGDEEKKKSVLQKLDNFLSPASVIIASCLGYSTTRMASWINKPERLVGFATFYPLKDRKIIELAAGMRSAESAIAAAERLFKTLGKEAVRVKDSAGLTFPRILSLIINEAARSLEEGVATAEEIDLAMKLGVNYPQGPLRWADQTGLGDVLEVVEGLERETGDDRYRPAPLLTKLVTAGFVGETSCKGLYAYNEGQVKP